MCCCGCTQGWWVIGRRYFSSPQTRGHAELHCGEPMSCSTLPYLLLHGPLCPPGPAEPPHGVFFMGPHLPFTEGGFRGRLTPPLLAQGMLKRVRGAQEGSDTRLGWGHPWEMKHPCLSSARSWCLRIQPVLGIATPVRFDPRGCYRIFSQCKDLVPLSFTWDKKKKIGKVVD